MTFAGNCNYSTPADGAAARVTLLAQLVSAGWTITNQSDGGTLGNAFNGSLSSWFAVQNPNGQGWCVQADSGGDVTKWRVKYANAPFIGIVSPSATQVPGCLSGVEVVLIGGGTDAAPTFNQLLAADGTYRWLVACDDAAPYGWHAMAFLSGGFGSRTLMMFDPLLANSYAPADANPYVVAARYGNGILGDTQSFTAPSGNFSSNTGVPAKLQGPTWVNLGYLGANLPGYGYQLGNGGEVGPNVYTGFEQRVLIGYARISGQGFSGYSSLITAGTCVTSPARTTGDVLQVGTDYFVRLDYLYLPWDSTAVVI
jgi:hypothetical protein